MNIVGCCVYLYFKVILNYSLFKEFNEFFDFYKYMLFRVNLKVVNLSNYTIVGIFFKYLIDSLKRWVNIKNFIN